MPTAPVNEQTPLLSPIHEREQADLPITTPTPLSNAKRLAILTLCFGLLITLAIGGTLVSTPIIDIQETIICHRIHGPDVGHDDAACKDRDVQSELSLIRGWHTSFSLLVSIIASVPYGAVADRYGRALVLGLALTGIALTESFGALVCAMPDVFPPRAIWLSSLFQFVGGGEAIFSAMVYTIAADISSEAQRATVFFYLGASLMAGAMIANPIVFVAMKEGPWFSITVGLACLAATALLAFFTPETLSFRQQHTPRTDNPSPSPPPTATTNGATTRPPSTTPTPPRQGIPAALSQTLKSARFLFWEHKLVGLLLLSLTLEILGRSVVLQLMQYASRRFGMSYSEAGLLSSVIALTSLLLLLVVLPGLSYLLLTKAKITGREKDLRLAQASAVLAALGTILQGLAETKAMLVAGIVVAGMGGGYTFMIRGLMTALVGGQEIGLMYTIIAFVEALAALVSGPVYAGLFRVGLGWGEEWVGFPFVVAGSVLVAAAVMVGVVSGSMVGEGDGKDDGVEDGDEDVG